MSVETFKQTMYVRCKYITAFFFRNDQKEKYLED